MYVYKSFLPSQVKVLTISGKFLWREGTASWISQIRDLKSLIGFILMRANREKHKQPKLLSSKGKNQFITKHLKNIMFVIPK